VVAHAERIDRIVASTGMAGAVDFCHLCRVMLKSHGPGGGREQTTADRRRKLRKREMLTANEVPFTQSLAAGVRSRCQRR
jgi:hypothetical protein